MNRQDKQLYDLFRQPWSLPREAQQGLERSYDQIRQQCREQEEPMKRRHRRPISIIAITAVAALFTISAAAVVLHTDFFRSAFGTGIKSEPVEVYKDPEKGSEVTFPAIERVEVDQTAAEEAVGEQVTASGQTIEACGYTITIDSYLVDKNGMGVLTYTIEHPDGISNLVEGQLRGSMANFNPWKSERESDIFEPRISVDGVFTDCYSYVDRDSVTDNKVTMAAYFCPFEPIDTPHELIFTVPYRTNTDAEDEANQEQSETVTLSVAELVDTVTYTDTETGISADVSPVGLKLNYAEWKQVNGLDDTKQSPVRMEEGEDGEPVPINERIEVTTDHIALHYADGSEYVIKGNDVLNTTVNAGNKESTYEFFVFNRLVTEPVASVEYSSSYADWDGIEYDVCGVMTR